MHKLVQPQATIDCRRCGKPFVSVNTTGRAGRAAYCPECRDEIYGERARRRRVRESCRLDLLRFGLTYCLDSYEGMKPLLKRPPSARMVRFVRALEDKILHGGLKHVRWRIELRRRARSEYYQCCGDALDNTPHFDTRGRG